MLFNECRTTQIFSIDVQRGTGKSAQTVRKVVIYPTGYHGWPESGGLMDQPHRLMSLFDIFMNAERNVAFKSMKP